MLIKSYRHIIGVYGTNPFQPLPPINMFDTKTRAESNYHVDPEWCYSLPTVKEKFHKGMRIEYPSFVAMHEKIQE